MVQTNGRADTVGSPIQLGDFLPERREVSLNGQTYRAWVTSNRRFPRSVQAELDTARNRYLRAVGPLLVTVDPEGEQSEDAKATALAAREQAIERADTAYARYTTEALLALVPGLSESEADMIDRETADRLLGELGYFEKPEPSADPVAEVKKETASPLTGDSSPPVSRATTRRAVQKRK